MAPIPERIQQGRPDGAALVAFLRRRRRAELVGNRLQRITHPSLESRPLRRIDQMISDVIDAVQCAGDGWAQRRAGDLPGKSKKVRDVLMIQPHQRPHIFDERRLFLRAQRRGLQSRAELRQIS
jgi:hypothetical protein